MYLILGNQIVCLNIRTRLLISYLKSLYHILSGITFVSLYHSSLVAHIIDILTLFSRYLFRSESSSRTHSCEEKNYNNDECGTENFGIVFVCFCGIR